MDDSLIATDSSEGSHLRKGFGTRDVIMVKESRVVEKVSVLGADVEIAGIILVTMRSPERQAIVGVKFEQAATTLALGGSGFVDFDEIPGLDGALGNIGKMLEQMAKTKRDYTEVTYTTRDGLIIGFYQDGLKQQAFMRFDLISRAIHFSSPKALAVIQGAVDRSKSYAAERRTSWGFA
jgi:hypothetical protein